MSASALLPQTAPFGDDDRLSLDRVLSAASPTQRAWLAGFLAGVDVGQPPLPRVDAPARAAEPLTILFASESGNAERLAQDVAKLAKKSGFKPRIVDFADLEIADLPKQSRLVVIAATWGEGEPPSRATRAYADLMGASAPRLEGTNFAVLALGDTAYAEFCGSVKPLMHGSPSLAPSGPSTDRLRSRFRSSRNGLDQEHARTLAPVQESSGNVVSVDFSSRASTEISREPVAAEIIEHVNLNSSRSGKETVHLALGFDGAAPAYEPGDSLELFPENDPALVDAVLAATGLPADDTLRAAPTRTGHYDPLRQDPRNLCR